MTEQAKALTPEREAEIRREVFYDVHNPIGPPPPMTKIARDLLAALDAARQQIATTQADRQEFIDKANRRAVKIAELEQQLAGVTADNLMWETVSGLDNTKAAALLAERDALKAKCERWETAGLFALAGLTGTPAEGYGANFPGDGIGQFESDARRLRITIESIEAEVQKLKEVVERKILNS